MVRAQFCSKTGLKKGTWSPDEDQKLINYIKRHGIWNWSEMPKFADLRRSGKSCRLRWVNYLKPNIKRGNFTRDEEETILKMNEKLGNKWSAIAEALPGRTDNEIKNHWHSHLKKLQHKPKAQLQECKVEANYQVNSPKVDDSPQNSVSSQLVPSPCSSPAGTNENPNMEANLGSQLLGEHPSFAEQLASIENLHAQNLQDMTDCMQQMNIHYDYILPYSEVWSQEPISPYCFYSDATSDLRGFNF